MISLISNLYYVLLIINIIRKTLWARPETPNSFSSQDKSEYFLPRFRPMNDNFDPSHTLTDRCTSTSAEVIVCFHVLLCLLPFLFQQVLLVFDICIYLFVKTFLDWNQAHPYMCDGTVHSLPLTQYYLHFTVFVQVLHFFILFILIV